MFSQNKVPLPANLCRSGLYYYCIFTAGTNVFLMHRINKILLIIILVFPSIIIPCRGQEAVKGILDLSKTVQTDNIIFRLNGEWEFYWKKLLRPADFISGSSKPDIYGKVPSYWTDYAKSGVPVTPDGYATYRLTVILPDWLDTPLGFDIPVFDDAYDIYINGIYFGGNGITAINADIAEPGYRRNFFRYDPPSDTLSIIINVSNFEHRRGGFWLPVKMGTFSKVQTRLANSWAASWAVISFLGGFSLFFLFFFLFSRKERMIGFFSLTTMGLAIRPLFVSHYLILNFIELPWIWIIRIEYLSMFLMLIGWTWFTQSLYPGKLFRKIVIAISIVFSVGGIFTILSPVKVFSYIMFFIYPVMLLLMIYLIIKSFVGIIRGKRIDIIYFFGFGLLFFAGIHDILVSLGRAESTGYIVTYFIVIFVFIQAAILLYNWVQSFDENAKLRSELQMLNRSLEEKVNKRTLELIKRNEEIENQSVQIALKNKQLSETIQLKNKIFSVIAHDLRSPVVNILYMLNLLKEKEYKEKYDTFANTSIQYAQMVVSLLENMLVWGRGQEEKIKYSPEKRNLTDIVLTNLSIVKETADKKEISVNFTQVGNSFAFIDKDLMDIIIRNILMNAVKYTHRGGRISILLKDKSSDGEGVVLKICDNGIGLSQEKQSKLFAAGEVESTPGTENEKGTGLGLKLCYELVQINKGTMMVESREGEGTCFIITLPVEAGSQVISH